MTRHQNEMLMVLCKLRFDPQSTYFEVIFYEIAALVLYSFYIVYRASSIV